MMKGVPVRAFSIVTVHALYEDLLAKLFFLLSV